MAQEERSSLGPPRGPLALAELRQALAPSAPRAPAPPIPSGVAALDAALGGGVPAGRLTELCGDGGRMGLALRILASASRRGLCAFVDADDGFDADTAERLGIDLTRLLWARVRRPEDALRAADILLRAGGFLLAVLNLCGAGTLRVAAGTWQRLVQRSEHAGTALLILSDAPTTGSAACATVACQRGRAQWQAAPGGRSVLVGQVAQLTLIRSRLGAPLEPLPLLLRR